LYICGTNVLLQYTTMAKVSYFLRSEKKKSEDVSIWCKLSNGRKLDVRVSTTLAIPFNQWDAKRECPKDYNGKNEAMAARLQMIDESLNGIRETLLMALAYSETFTPAQVRELVTDYLSRQKAPKTSIPSGILEYLTYCIDGMKTGDFRHKGQPYDANTVKVYNSLYKVLDRFIGKKAMKFEDLNKETVLRFSKFLESEGYLVKTINKYIVTFRALVNNALEDNLISDYGIPKLFYKMRETEGSKTKSIYLSETEIQALYDMPLEGYDTKVRDVFLLGCYTGQRVSDYSRLSPENFSMTANGTKVVRLVQEKTGNKVTVPVLNQNLLVIAQKYNYDIPHVPDVLINRYIKTIYKGLSKSVTSLSETEQTVITMKERDAEKAGKVTFKHIDKTLVERPRYELVCTHTARRSCITNLYLTGMFDDHQLRSISGHKTQAAFENYLCMSGDEIAEKMAAKAKAWTEKEVTF